MRADPTTPTTERRAHPRPGPDGWVLDMLYRTLRWVAGHVRGFYAAVGVFLVVGLALALVALASFAFLAEIVAAGAVQSMDDAIVQGARSLESPFLDALALLGAGLGSGGAAWFVVLAGSVFLWRTHHHYSVYLLWISLGGARFLNTLLKDWFARPRPDFFRGEIDLLGWTFSFPSSYSFPSGHALTSTVIFLTLAYLIARLEPTRRMRRATLLVAVLAVVLVGLSRIYLGVHYPSDVLAGVAAGFLWATSAALGIEAVRYFRTRKPEIVAEEHDIEKGIRPLEEALHG